LRCAGSMPAAGAQPLLPELTGAHQNRRDVVRVGSRQIVNPEDERRAAQLNRGGEQTVERNQDRNGSSIGTQPLAGLTPRSL
jgi:hypothetical protein